MEMRFTLLAGSIVAAAAVGVFVAATVDRAGDHEIELLSLRAEAGDPESLFRLGVLSAEGLGVDRDESRAVDLWDQAAIQGHARSMSALGWAYVRGVGVAADPAYGESWFRQAADLGDADAMMALSQRCLDSGQTEDAAMWVQLASVGRPQFNDYADSIRARLDAKGREEVARRCGEWMAAHASIVLAD
jgi:TPR repeat protein